MLNKTLIFDFDGTLIDSMPMWQRRIIELLEDGEITYPENIIEIITPLGYVGMAKYLIELGLEGTVDEMLEVIYDFAYEEYKNNIPAKNTVTETLRELRARGHSLNILTAAQHKMLDSCLVRLGIWDMFDNVWSSDDFGLKKSNKAIYGKVAKTLDTTVEQCTFFDDNITALKTAKEAGMSVVGVYDATSEKFADEIKEFADGYVVTFSEILALS